MYYVLPLSLTIIIILLKVTLGHAHLWFGCHIPLCSIWGGARQSILKQHLHCSLIYINLVSSITALVAGELRQHQKVEICMPT